MSARSVVVLIVVALLGAFAALNWEAFTVRTSLNLLITRAEAPVGLVMLGVAAGLTGLYFPFALGVTAAALVEGKRRSREIQALRKLAEEAETSRYTELRTHLHAELGGLGARCSAVSTEVIARLERVEDCLKTEIEQAGNSLAAYIGELEERLTRKSQG